ncbi:MAG: LicD family protein [Clostridia bacterium]|nr:LicD family protein [Clostridia bacterium]
MYTKYKNGSFLANHSGAWGVKEIMPKDWYGDGVDLEFEGLTIKAPTKWHEWLTQVYGNYMELPPVEKRVGHHYTEIVDLEKTYLEYYHGV